MAIRSKWSAAFRSEIPGDGVSPLPRILLKLSEKGYSGPLSVKLFNPRMQNGDPFEVVRRIPIGDPGRWRLSLTAHLAEAVRKGVLGSAVRETLQSQDAEWRSVRSGPPHSDRRSRAMASLPYRASC